jgi:D-alanyl-D-alanine carboxypeptidase
MVIERVSDQPYDTFMAEQIFAPLGMDATVYAPQPEGLALGYEGRGTNTNPAEPFDLSVAYAAYGLSSTLDDMYRWNRALLNGDLLPPAQREAMLAAHIRDSYGWEHGYATITSDQAQPGHHVVGVGVPWTIYPGFWASNVALTDLDLTVVVLANRGYGIREDPIMPFMSDILVGAPYLNPGS